MKAASKPGLGLVPGTKARPAGAPSARKRPACGPGGARCKGGVSSSQALAWNRRTCRLGTVGQSKWVKLAPWLREGGPQAADTARDRGGTARMSDEDPVMGSEQRGRAGQIDRRSTPLGEEPTEGSKPKAKS